MTDKLRVADVDAAARHAAERLEGRVVHTAVQPYEALSSRVGASVWLKLENQQHTGSFKFRGAVNRLLTLDEATRRRGVVVASSGNHGAAVARAMRELDTPGVIFVPEQVSARKLATIRDLGADVRLYGTNGLDTELHARDHADANGMFYLSPYNDPEVIAGQGSIGVELLDDLPELEVAIIAVGGGGLLSGVASVLRTARPDVRIVAVQPAASAVMALSVDAGRIVDADDEPTLSDGTAGGIEEGAITFDLVRELADEFVLVSEFEIATAMRDLEDDTGMVVEGAAALTLAAINIDPARYRGRNVLALICGGNIAPDTVTMARAMAGSAAQ